MFLYKGHLVFLFFFFFKFRQPTRQVSVGTLSLTGNRFLICRLRVVHVCISKTELISVTVPRQKKNPKFILPQKFMKYTPPQHIHTGTSIFPKTPKQYWMLCLLGELVSLIKPLTVGKADGISGTLFNGSQGCLLLSVLSSLIKDTITYKPCPR